jgi:hypothetical protein
MMMKQKEVQMTDIHSVLKFVSLDASNEDLTKLVTAIKYRREEMTRRNKYALKTGQAVTFSSRGVHYMGVIKSIKVKKAVVECSVPGVAYDSKMHRVPNTISYNVPLDMLVAA